MSVVGRAISQICFETTQPVKKRNRQSAGLSLLELIIDIALISVLLMFLIVLIDPMKQLQKGKAVRRQHDVNELKKALETYYNDHNCYPISLPFNQEWSENGVVYMKKVPQDADCGKGVSCYIYQTDATQACPQWHVIYAESLEPTATATTCPLLAFPSACVPANYDARYACNVAGNVDCNYVAGSTLVLPTPSPSVIIPTPNATVIPTPTDFIPTETPVATPTPTPDPMCIKEYACTGGNPVRCNRVPAGTGEFCGFNNCSGGACCDNRCQ